jgi:polyisoprenoid-binding protein YceI
MKIIDFTILLIFFQSTFGQSIDINNSWIKFDSKYLQNSIIEGTIKGINGKVLFNPDNIESSSVDITIDVTTINTGYEKRDLALLEKNIFDTLHYPLITFKSTKFEQNGDNYTVTGNLGIKDVTKEIYFPFTFSSNSKQMIIKGNIMIDRFDYKVGENISTITAGNEVNLNINLVLKL